MTPSLEWIVVVTASLFAGLVDAIVGGGGLVLVPALFGVFPSAAPATLFGTNKGAAIWGTAWAAWRYARRVDLPWRSLLLAALAAGVGSFVGAWAVTRVPAEGLRLALPVVLAAVLIYTVAKKDLGRSHAPKHSGRAHTLWACGIGAVVGFYDGLFGPGTGSFFVFLFVRILGYDFLHASASAKLLNTATNLTALVAFAWTGHVWWALAAVMALANVVGSVVGTHLALRHGAGFVRKAFIVVVSGLILKTGYDALMR